MAMKFFITICSVLLFVYAISAQQPKYGPFTKFSSSGFNYCTYSFQSVTSANLYAQFVGYNNTNFGTEINPAQLDWFGMPVTSGFPNGYIMREESAGPIVTNTGPSAGLYSVDFTSAGELGAHFMQWASGGGSKINGSNQPNTIFVVCTDTAHTGNGSSLYDGDTGGSGRELERLTSDGTGGLFFAGSSVTTYVDANNGNYFIYTAVYNGASSYVRTNGVKAATGNPGVGAFGFPILGNDNTHVTGYEGKVWAVLAYAGAMNTNEMIAVERALNCQGVLGYSIPGP